MTALRRRGGPESSDLLRRLSRLHRHGRLPQTGRRRLSPADRAARDRPQHARPADLRPRGLSNMNTRDDDRRARSCSGGRGPRRRQDARPRQALPGQAGPLDRRRHPRQRIHRDRGLPLYHRQAPGRLRRGARDHGARSTRGRFYICPIVNPDGVFNSVERGHLPARQRRCSRTTTGRQDERGRPRRPRRRRPSSPSSASRTPTGRSSPTTRIRA